MDTLVLNNGLKIPKIGYGTYQTPPSRTQKCVEEAIRIGYRHIDTAQCYGNEKEVWLAVENSRIPEDEIFITTKLWACGGYSDTARSIDGSLARLGKIDLLLMHEPMGNVHEVYRAMEDALKEGKVKSIGISNFMPDRYLDLLAHCTVVPAVNQVETHIFRQQKELRKLERKYGTVPMAWSPLACGRNNIFANETLCRIAGKHGRTAAQVALRFLHQQDIAVIPKSTHRERMLENLSISDFALTRDEMDALSGLDRGKSLFGWW